MCMYGFFALLYAMPFYISKAIQKTKLKYLICVIYNYENKRAQSTL
jgi:hypothetical protein